MPKLLKDPLLHFVLIGAAIFLAFGIFDDDASLGERRIVVTEEETSSLWQALSMLSSQTPTEADIYQLVEPRIREEILYREALALGLDRDDTQIRQRLVEKMSFLTEDLLPAEPPTDAELAAFFDAHADEFTTPPRVSFEQIHFSPGEHGDAIDAAAADALTELTARGAQGNAPSAIAVTERYDDVTAEDLRGEFGGEFAAAVFELPADGAWHGPLRSFFGAHLVRVTSHTDAAPSAFDDARARVLSAFNAERRRVANEAAYESIRARYDIVIEISEAVRRQWQSE